MLNDNLREQIIINLYGRIITDSNIFNEFNHLVNCEIAFMFTSSTQSMDDVIFEEGDESQSMFFITKGQVLIVHKKTSTFLKSLQIDESFGEIGFFNGRERKATAKSRGFTETLILQRDKFAASLKQ